MKLKITLAAIGTTLALTSLWVGAYGCHSLPSWAEMPCFTTAFLGFVGGIILAVFKPINDSMK